MTLKKMLNIKGGSLFYILRYVHQKTIKISYWEKTSLKLKLNFLLGSDRFKAFIKFRRTS